ncbi:uncharacterized protein YdhG (YjbR/CyaY superfamily) [Paenibacillus cellulosilyticus]|uniref:Uncharacterized protein YdhG (YjbR/CyaY superfamily) n=1 Tax=Paenibacillus cellulosilyticus TaxID=375489 RepID=A0A2V2YPU9_9BACL|nr:DUF1801 domain-containing protein [Paenibacillus cellulosilyticus]PWV98540.1 uncharacterized protein YdhG (YjbR/CyaY superfamily) [Paenibacillus cellulosilyticus]QKS44146.1 DUF1801 domain-containing protein [Paenibacillus cellulosilyticus]
MPTTFNTPDEYIASFAPDIQEKLQSIRSLIKQLVPEATEKISYAMPAFALHGNLVFYAAFKNHIGFYPSGSGIAAFEHEFIGLKWSKGAVQFPMDKPIPYDLISRIVEFRAGESRAKAEAKKTAKKAAKKA